MHINPVSNINFCAKVVKNDVSILKRDGSNGYIDCNASLVEFDVKSREDIKRIWEICKMPEFAMYSYELPQSLSENMDKGEQKHCYALVSKADNNSQDFNNENVLGIFTLDETKETDSSNKIALFMTNLRFRTKWCDSLRNKEFTHIGEGMVEALKSIFPNQSLSCYSEPWAVKFWEKNGFKEISEQHMLFRR